MSLLVDGFSSEDDSVHNTHIDDVIKHIEAEEVSSLISPMLFLYPLPAPLTLISLISCVSLFDIDNNAFVTAAHQNIPWEISKNVPVSDDHNRAPKGKHAHIMNIFIPKTLPLPVLLFNDDCIAADVAVKEDAKQNNQGSWNVPWCGEFVLMARGKPYPRSVRAAQ